MTEEAELVLTLDDPPVTDSNRAIKDITCGVISGIAQVFVSQPFDITKVRLQSAKPGEYSSVIDVISKLIKNEGPLAFYKGTLTPLIGIGACVSIQFGVNEFMKRSFNSMNGKDGLITNQQFFMCGMASGFANGFLASPIEHVRIRLQTQKGNAGATKPEFNGPLSVIKKLYGNGGTKLIFKGLGPTLIRESFGMGSYFMTFEMLVKNEMVNRKIERSQIESWKLCLFGGLAGYAMWLTVYPIDVIKSTLQTDNYLKPQLKNSIDASKAILKQNGYKGFFKGFTPAILRAAPVNAATFLAFELSMRAIG
ncbi:hypothetical protein CANARDRAFT_175202 [[Candida] arabinofermentans NRRL YB-2248]|uniref:Mitochondrial carrier protein n=1 Tax=[Candida] arabinofermentans NRRL YB-2248 TaxID=983967 RepID=A0A1E4T3I1_9ASCO|nr:hypothetical protein CANARDRAFT_175202 [[Candida] arabinofermentans NRRL YB-2248]